MADETDRVLAAIERLTGRIDALAERVDAVAGEVSTLGIRMEAVEAGGIATRMAVGRLEKKLDAVARTLLSESECARLGVGGPPRGRVPEPVGGQ